MIRYSRGFVDADKKKSLKRLDKGHYASRTSAEVFRSRMYGDARFELAGPVAPSTRNV